MYRPNLVPSPIVDCVPGPPPRSYAQLDVSDLSGTYTNFGVFDPSFDLPVPAPKPSPPPPSPKPKRSPPPPRRTPFDWKVACYAMLRHHENSRQWQQILETAIATARPPKRQHVWRTEAELLDRIHAACESSQGS